MLMIRLRRQGARSKPFYRVVVSDSRKTPRSSAVEELGTYDPGMNPPQIKVDQERYGHWVAKGARVTPTIKKLLAR